ncbi:ATP-dependent DNA helicase [Bordetella sp. N]|uniref:ATP-dependent DNA helicase n=1 Tax=Bordetella sp. N TaxID=1746199 RepID=UPI00070C4E32|nr:ATP-dependent DNA helicase [Bordetella sp. N]ALM86852.1 ATP-dependent DNA helicase [Bordetella sp. N]
MSYTIAVRALCEFTARAGDLDTRFTPAPTGQEGTAGHQAVVARRAAGYEAEVALEGFYRPTDGVAAGVPGASAGDVATDAGDAVTLRVRGRADGYDPGKHRLEEIKTRRASADRVPDNQRAVHWAQAMVYGHLLCLARGFADLEVALVYFELGTQEETVLTRACSAAELAAFFNEQCQRFLAWGQQESTHRDARDTTLRGMAFPQAAFRPGQRELAAAIYRVARDGKPLLAQAPTGIGKTLGSLFPMLKAMPAAPLDRVFFLCAKTAGRQAALDAVAKVRDASPLLPLRTLELAAREQSCVYPGRDCNGEDCPLARGFYDRLPAARAEAALAPVLDRPALASIAAGHGICPYYLGQEMARWSDVVIGDYNYYYDYNGLLHGLTQALQWRVGVLVDEAHNLVERARGMYSGQLSAAQLSLARRAAPKFLRKPLDNLRRVWRASLGERAEEGYRVYDDLPGGLLTALQRTGATLAEYFAEPAAEAEEDLLTFYFDLLRFLRLAESHGAHSLFDAMPAEPERGAGARVGREIASVGARADGAGLAQAAGVALPQAKQRAQALETLCVRNVIPAPFLTPKFAAAHATVLFSATLSPAHFYRDTLGLPADCPWVDVPGPFQRDQLAIHLVDRVSTRFRDRAASVAPIVDLMARAYGQQAGNYLCFSSSFDYLALLAEHLARTHPGIPMWRQASGMDPKARAEFLDRFVADGQGIGFAVLGGAFGEGVDLPGSRLIGAFIVTLGLPQMNPVNEEMMRRMQARFGQGYDYTYLYPGLRKVVQAAGRVIRSEADRGSVYLIDDRYRRPEVRRLLPTWWEV